MRVLFLATNATIKGPRDGVTHPIVTKEMKALLERDVEVLFLGRHLSKDCEIDDQYPIERSIEAPKLFFNFFINESAAARDDLSCMLDLRFGPTVEENLDMLIGAEKCPFFSDEGVRRLDVSGLKRDGHSGNDREGPS